MGDKKGTGEVDHEDYLILMRHVGLIPSNTEKDDNAAPEALTDKQKEDQLAQ